jgi:hypothetical protein
MRVGVSYHSLSLADVSIHAIVVQPQLAQSIRSVPIQDDPKHVGRPPPGHPIPSLPIFHQVNVWNDGCCHFVNAVVFLYIVFALCKLASYTFGLSHLSNDASHL